MVSLQGLCLWWTSSWSRRTSVLAPGFLLLHQLHPKWAAVVWCAFRNAAWEWTSEGVRLNRTLLVDRELLEELKLPWSLERKTLMLKDLDVGHFRPVFRTYLLFNSYISLLLWSQDLNLLQALVFPHVKLFFTNVLRVRKYVKRRITLLSYRVNACKTSWKGCEMQPRFKTQLLSMTCTHLWAWSWALGAAAPHDEQTYKTSISWS